MRLEEETVLFGERYNCPARSIDSAITESDFGPPYSPRTSSSWRFRVSQPARHLNTIYTARCLDLTREPSFPCCLRNARTWLTFGMNAFSSNFLASAMRASFFSPSDTLKDSTAVIAVGFVLGLDTFPHLSGSVSSAFTPVVSEEPRPSSDLRTSSYLKPSTRTDRILWELCI